MQKGYLCCRCIGHGFEKFGIIDKKELSGLLKVISMLSYYLKCRKNTESKNQKLQRQIKKNYFTNISVGK